MKVWVFFLGSNWDTASAYLSSDGRCSRAGSIRWRTSSCVVYLEK